MRIAQVAPLHESVPPKLYGGTERVVFNLTEELVKAGHEVTLFASGDSVTSARLVPACPRALRLDRRCRDRLPHLMVQLEQVAALADTFDIVHFHVDYLHFSVSRARRIPNLTTLHGRLDLPDLAPVFRTFPEMPVVSISDAQRQPMPWLNWRGTIHHGLPVASLEAGPGAGGYLAFLGRISPEKRADRAIEIARRSGRPIKIAAKVDAVDWAYFENEIRHQLADSMVEFVGEISEGQKSDFLGNASALLFPIDWPEPFGLVMIEAMACGTPTIAFRAGSVPEVISDGKTGFVVDSVEAAVAAVDRLGEIPRDSCRREFERRFTGERMAGDYLAVYEQLSRNTDRQAARAAHE